ncbi:G-type lectin S-receptor-like serine/threonine-protein kinase At4g27290 [Euphorbia lathyris]|uniref:G-type lectin S-receptor-like serine/threonine-protein kinase At4g27290 n=1 Tax=Euphorbia lathyris TaxID=212925 RepID=UPI003313C953
MNFTVFLCFFLISISRVSIAKDILLPGESMKDGETLISRDGNFELGFFTPNNSSSRYLGIWYKKLHVKTVVWIANIDAPFTNTLGVVQVNRHGFIILQNSTKSTVWSSNKSRNVQNPVAQLLDSGNFVVKDGNNTNFENIVWQSFDFPYDTLLPGMKLGWDLDTGLNRILSSWKTEYDPSKGDYSCFIDLRGFPQIFIMKGAVIDCRIGPWNGIQFAGSPQLKPNPIFEYKFVSNQHEIYYSYELKNSSVVSTLKISEKGVLERHVWIEKTQSWLLFFSVPTDQCDKYALCGPNGICNISSYPVCECLEGFVPKSLTDWNASDWSDGCVRRAHLSCQNGDRFLKHSRIQLPDTSSSWVDKSIGLNECEELCLRNCSCVAYSNSDIRGSGCLLWFDDLIDMRVFAEGGQDIYIKMSASELEKEKLYQKKKAAIIISCLVLAMGILALGLFLHILQRKCLFSAFINVIPYQNMLYIYNISGIDQLTGGYGVEEKIELRSFSLATIKNATDNFSLHNKLGEGGFGPVYKGTLLDGQEIAVKRLSQTSGQGQNEFRNEVVMIAKLQHRNLVKLLGCCIQGGEKLLIYDYLPNKSLDSIIFDKTKSKFVDWDKRFYIISGIAKGLLYLHQDSRLRIIHRDLKASNILLDGDMNPKISDFGLARIISKDQTAVNTKRVVGTYGYMAPECTMDGHFSIKSDVFSFGVLVLEIVSGERNQGFCHPDHGHNLVGHVWRLGMKEKELEVVDNCVLKSCCLNQVQRCIQVALLCVQTLPEDRPDMLAVVVMLRSEGLLPQPKPPGFYTERNPFELESSKRKEGIFSRAEITTTSIGPR